MRRVQEEPMETVHVYIVPANERPPRPDYVAISITTLCSLFLIAVICLSLFAPTPTHEVSFSLAVPGFSLATVSKSMNVTAIATGKRYVAATTATGTITFYNGAIYMQIIPIGTMLKGRDGITVITNEQATIPPAAQTTPPTYGQVSVTAQAVTAGGASNIRAGDINEACCVTSFIAQNPYSFTGGRNAYTFTYLTAQDVKHTAAPITQEAQQQALLLFTNPLVLDPTCVTTLYALPPIGQKTLSAHVTVTVTCAAVSYSTPIVTSAILAYSKRFGVGSLNHIQVQVVGITKGAVIRLYITAMWEPIIVHRFFAS